MTFDIILIIIFFLAWNEYDFIIFQKRFSIMNLFLKKDSKKYKWYFTNNYRTTSFWKKNVFVFLLDGMHLNSSIWRYIAFLWVSRLIYQDWEAIALSIALYASTGFLHSVWNGSLFRRTK